MVNRSGAGPVFARVRGLLLLAVLLLGGVLLLKRDASTPSSHDSRVPASSQIQNALAHLPISFEPNLGQTDSSVKFLAHANGYGLYLSGSSAYVTFPERTHSGMRQSTVEMQFAGANLEPEIAGAEQLPGHSNYFIGNNAARWLHNVPQFRRVEYRDIYSGIDLAFYGNENRIEYDFEVSPGTDPRQIELDFKGATKVSITKDGDLALGLKGHQVLFQAPHVYQKTSDGDQAVAGSFVLRGDDRAGFEVGAYDRSRTLIIDPVLTFSSYLGGSGDESCTAITGASAGFVPHCPSVAVDSGTTPRIYLTGATTSVGTFSGVTPSTTNTTGGTENVFVSRISLSSSGGVTTATLDYVTYIGGSTGASPVIQYPAGIGVDSGFNVYVAGTTNASDFPTTASGYQTTAATAGNHAFVTEIDQTGSANLYSTYLSGNGTETAANMAVDSLGRVYVIGTTTSSNFPTTVGAIQPTANATNQFFFSKINPALNTLNSLQYSTYIGGSTPANGIVTGGAIAVDSMFNVYLAGGTNFTDLGSPNPWILNAYQATPQAGLNVWAAKLNAPATSTQQYTLAFGTYFGGSGDDVAYGVATDGTDTYVTGSTTSTDIVVPLTAAYQTSNAGGGDAFVIKLGVPATVGTSQGQVPLDYFSYLGGSAQDVGLGIVADSLGDARVVGLTASADFPTSVPFQGTYGGGAFDAFEARLNTTGTTCSSSTSCPSTSSASFLGGSGTDIGTSIALDASLNTYLTGETNSGNFPTASPLASGGSLSGSSDAFITEIGPNTSGLSMPQTTSSSALPACNAANPTASPSPVGVGNPITFNYYIYNTGDPVSGVDFTDTLGPNSGQTTATVQNLTPGSNSSCQAAVSSGTLTCTLGNVGTSTIATLSTANSCGVTQSVNYTVHVTVTVQAPITVLLGSGSVGNAAALSFPGGTLPTISGSVPLNDYSVSASLAAPSTSSTIPSGGQVNFSITVTPTGAGFPESVSLACGSGLPSGATCTFTNNPIANLSNGAQSRTLAIATTARITTTTGLFHRGPFYALWLPVLGVGLMGAGASRKRRMLLAAFFAALLTTALLQAGCSSTSSTTSTTGTPAGTYTVTVNATSGSAVRTTTAQFTVQ
ncbi:MAG TPA: SBBP repeat-containing protein [Terriglobales bacterium]|nr:SBBP repeat-containing protein [Terriglobales bacterium]